MKPKIIRDVEEIKSDVGNKNELVTSDKSNLVSAMNELFTNVSNGKALVGGAITGVDDSVVIPTDPTFSDLASAIGNISTGKKWASGGPYYVDSSTKAFLDVSGSSRNHHYISVTENLGFTPRTIIVVGEDYQEGCVASKDFPLMSGYNIITTFRPTGGLCFRLAGNANITDEGFTIPVGARYSWNCYWIAIE